MLMLVSLQTMATETFTNDRTDFRDESIYFMITTRFYDGDPKNNVLCWDNQAAQIETKDPLLTVTDFRRPRLSWLDGRCVQGPGTYSPRHG